MVSVMWHVYFPSHSFEKLSFYLKMSLYLNKIYLSIYSWISFWISFCKQYLIMKTCSPAYWHLNFLLPSWFVFLLPIPPPPNCKNK